MFVNAFMAMCGIACGLPLLFVVHALCRKYTPDQARNLNERSVELMEERNRLDAIKAESLERIAACAESVR